MEVNNPGMMRIGMFVTATFYGKKPETHAAVPASAILHLHDREWVYMPLGDGHFRRVEVVTGSMLPGNNRKSFPESSRATKSSQTRSICRIRSRSSKLSAGGE